MHTTTNTSVRLIGKKAQTAFPSAAINKNAIFHACDSKEAIRMAKSSTAIGPDGMSTIYLKKLVHIAINYLNDIFHLSISTGRKPEKWHKVIIIPILKPGKDDNGKNSGYISLLCPAAKTLEKVLMPQILINIPFHPVQHGFRPKQSTCTALTTITADIAAGFSRKYPARRTVHVALDLTAAFGNVGHQQLLDCVFNTNISATIRRWFYNY